ncbi:MAG: hypothetical protein LBL84_02110 [Candidatus Nomurabacteria bacterium]|jgi:hypothetical protein|nr:hypothetical protein [Candidatus Nomurabacteria bacterium]
MDNVYPEQMTIDLSGEPSKPTNEKPSYSEPEEAPERITNAPTDEASYATECDLPFTDDWHIRSIYDLDRLIDNGWINQAQYDEMAEYVKNRGDVLDFREHPAGYAEMLTRKKIGGGVLNTAALIDAMKKGPVDVRDFTSPTKYEEAWRPVPKPRSVEEIKALRELYQREYDDLFNYYDDQGIHSADKIKQLIVKKIGTFEGRLKKHTKQ